MPAPISFKRRVDRKLPRVWKAGRRWVAVAAGGGRPDTRVVFVVGSQRCGTRLPMEIMDRSPEIATFSEGAAPFFDGVLLQPLERVERLIRRSPFPIVALKPICETHRIDELLGRFPDSRAVWIFRDWLAAAQSATIKWTSGREGLRRLAAGELRAAGWRAGGLDEEKLGLVRRLYSDRMSELEANAVMWYLRNALFFDTGACRRPDVLLVQYEDLLANPHERFARLFDFVGTPTPVAALEAVRRPRGSKLALPPISPEIAGLCEALQTRLLAHYDSSLAGTPGRESYAGAGETR